MSYDELVELKLSEMLADRPRRISELAIQLRRFVVGLASNCPERVAEHHPHTPWFSRQPQAYLA